LVNSIEKKLELWKPAQLPEPVMLSGQWVALEPLSAARHGHALWSAVNGHDEVWRMDLMHKKSWPRRC